MKSILVPTDFSENAFNALTYAFGLFKDEKVTFHLLHAFRVKANLADVAISDHETNIFEDHSQETVEELQVLKKKAIAQRGRADFKFETIAVGGDLEDAVEALVKETTFDFVVLGTQGATGAREIFLGSNTVRVVKRLKDIAVLVVPEDFHFVPLNKILYPTAYKYPFTEANLDVVNYVCDLWNCTVEVLYVEGSKAPLNEDALAHKAKLAELLTKPKLDFITIEGYTSVSKSIVAYSKRNNDNLVVLNYHEHGFFEQLLKEPIVKKVAFHSEIPLLIIT
ncbi:universal stress protein [Winogradskyella alexanderae]|uniref:Universal stress protein n=1 Tax=Winogradskyella alexanderae TaxID=2877123 RepID=A0ABS7XUK4_9FLAO|nr:universal stress protein [Winogradskyella alexanderae]MCA0133455.1 universal stress protein [Winogradskyella alexanderae]